MKKNIWNDDLKEVDVCGQKIKQKSASENMKEYWRLRKIQAEKKK